MDWSSIAKQVSGAIKSVGGDATLRRIVDAAPTNALKPWIVPNHDPAQDVTTAVKLVWDEVGIKDAEDADSLRFGYLPVLDIVPLRGDFIEEASGSVWQIVNDPIQTAPGGTTLMWSVRLRKWPGSASPTV